MEGGSKAKSDQTQLVDLGLKGAHKLCKQAQAEGLTSTVGVKLFESGGKLMP